MSKITLDDLTEDQLHSLGLAGMKHLLDTDRISDGQAIKDFDAGALWMYEQLQVPPDGTDDERG